jgi:hypothetical protein
MNHEQFRVILFDLLDHHLEMVEESATSEDIDYHCQRVRWFAAYLKQNTVAKDPTENEMIAYLAQ